MVDDISIIEQLKAVSQAFKMQLPEKGVEITRQWSAIKKDSHDLVALEALYRLTHNLAGAGGTFGFSRITDVAREVTDPLRVALKERKTGLTATERTTLEGPVKLLIELCMNPSDDAKEEIAPAPTYFPELPSSLHAPSKLIYLYSESDNGMDTLIENLQNLGAHVCQFDTRQTLVKAVNEQMPSVILFNPISAGNDFHGLDLTSVIQLPPMVMLADTADFKTRLTAVREGMEGFLVKPVEASSVLNLVDSFRPQEETAPFRVLIVDDDQNQAEYASIVLNQAGITTRTIYDPTEILDQLAEFNPELLLFDIYMPQCSGIELAKIVRQMDNYVSVPILFLSVETERGRQLEALQTGADDFLTKPIRPKELVSAVKVRAWRARTLRWMMVRDSLTGLFNHAVIMERLSNSFTLAKRQESPLSVAMIDIDHFKRINDNYGHSTGDKVLVSFSRLLRERLRGSDIVGRYGGEEFLVVLPDTTIGDAQLVLDEVRVAFAKTPFTANNKIFSATLSVGIADYPHANSATELLDTADMALYQAKEQGRDRTMLATPP
ncbi:MAG: diguanylate cyclase [Sedimenticola sp.]|nr:diguanylate cyclase [Sedimenticola sp.]